MAGGVPCGRVLPVREQGELHQEREGHLPVVREITMIDRWKGMDLKHVVIACPVCGAKMTPMPICDAVSCGKCMTRLPAGEVERVREGLRAK